MKKLATDIEEIGVGVEIHPDAQFINVRELRIGDYTYIGPNVRVIGGRLSVGDYAKIHNNGYIYAKNGISLGHNAWIGQGTHLDGTGGIRAGNFLGVGINSALYSHIRHGDISQGCRFEADSFLEIGDDVWFVGMCLVSPIKAADKSMAMLGSVVTKDMALNRVYGGSPAKDITDKVGPQFKELSIDEKIKRVQAHISLYLDHNSKVDRERFRVVDKLPTVLETDVTYFDVSSRSYTKTRAEDEVALCRWLFPYRAKFKPIC